MSVRLPRRATTCLALATACLSVALVASGSPARSAALATCRVSSDFTIGQVNLYNATTDYAGTWVNVPLDATNITSSEVDLATGDPPEETITAGAVEESWHGLYFGRPANQEAYTGLKTLPFKVPSISDAWIAVYSFGSVGNPPTSLYGKTMRWRYTATYTVPGECPSSAATPKPTPSTTSPSASSGTTTQTTAPPQSSSGSSGVIRLTVTKQHDGSLLFSMPGTGAGAPPRHLVIEAPHHYTFTSAKGSGGLRCRHGSYSVTCTAGASGAVAVDSVIVDLAPEISKPLQEKISTSDGKAAVELTITGAAAATTTTRQDREVAEALSLFASTDGQLQKLLSSVRNRELPGAEGIDRLKPFQELLGDERQSLYPLPGLWGDEFRSLVLALAKPEADIDLAVSDLAGPSPSLAVSELKDVPAALGGLVESADIPADIRAAAKAASQRASAILVDAQAGNLPSAADLEALKQSIRALSAKFPDVLGANFLGWVDAQANFELNMQKATLDAARAEDDPATYAAAASDLENAGRYASVIESILRQAK